MNLCFWCFLLVIGHTMPLNIHVQIYLSCISKYSYPYIPLGCFLLCSFPLHLCLSFLALHFLNPVDNPYSSWLELVIHILIIIHKFTRFIWIDLLPRRPPFGNLCSPVEMFRLVYFFAFKMFTWIIHL
jgi:hypothetical protein